MSESARRKRYGGGMRGHTESGENQNGYDYRSQTGNSSQNRRNPPNQTSRMNSFDNVRKIVQEEGRTARNLVLYNVPVDKRLARKGRPLTRQRRHSSHKDHTPSLKGDGNVATSSSKLKGKHDSVKSSKLESSGRKPDLRAVYWAFLFDNLQRAVEAIYQTCEQDESEVECKEVIMMLNQSAQDFRSLIERVRILRAFEDAAKEGGRPSSVAWELRKMSPGKNTSHSPMPDRSSPSPAQRSLNFSGSLASISSEPRRTTPSGNSWADMVKGVTSTATDTVKGASSMPTDHMEKGVTSTATDKSTSAVSKSSASDPRIRKIQSPINGIDEDDIGGWETVQKGGKVKGRNSPAQKPIKSHLNKAKRSPRDKRKPKDYQPDEPSSIDNKTIAPAATKQALKSIPAETRSVAERVADAWTDRVPSLITCGAPYDLPNGADVSGSSDLANIRPCGEDEHHSNNGPTDKSYEEEDLSSSDSLTEDETDREEEAEDELNEQLENALAMEDTLTNQLEQEQEQALESAIQEEESWLKELAREESMEIVVETEPDTESDLGATVSSLDISQPLLDWVSDYDPEIEGRRTKSWAEQVEDAESRIPGHGVHMHEKLSSPSRKRSPTESRKRHEQKQAKALEQREKLMQEKSEQLRELSKKVDVVRAWKEELLKQRRETIQRKMQRADEKRQVQLQRKAKKAHDEETKANEIAFINTLEAQNKRHEILSKYQESEARLQEIQEERQRKLEEKLAKEAAVEERRKALEAERIAKLQEMQERRKQRDARVELQLQEREKERHEAVKAREREREERLATLNANQQAHIEELQKKIQQKQDESSQRHEQQLQNIREKAFEMSILRHSTGDHNDAPQLIPYDQQKLCNVCNVVITSEVYLLSHLRGKKHQQSIRDNNAGKAMSNQEIESFNLKNIANAPDASTNPKIISEKERLKSQKKRCKKLRQRMSARGVEFENTLSGIQQTIDSEHKAKLQKLIKDLNKYIQSQDSGPWPQNRVSALDRALGELVRILDKKMPSDQNSFRILGGMTTLSRLFLVIDNTSNNSVPVIPAKSFVLASTVFRLACKGCYDNCRYMLFSNKVVVLIDVLIHHLSQLLPDGRISHASSSTSLINVLLCNTTCNPVMETLPVDVVAMGLLQLVAIILSCLAKRNPSSIASEASVKRMGVSGDSFLNRENDIISYIISVGIIDKLSQYFNGVRGPIEGDKDGAEFLQHSLGMLMAMTKFLSKRNSTIFDHFEDGTQLISTYEVTELVGILSLLYGILLHSGTAARTDAAPPELPQHTLLVTITGIRMLNHMATLDLNMLQRTLGEEGLSLEFRHICSYLIWYCSHHANEELLHEVILCVGYFTVLHPDNQVIVQSGQPPTVLQQLCVLPFQYFCDPHLMIVLFPSLIGCSYNNKQNCDILDQEFSCALLANFIEEKHLEGLQAKLTPSVTSLKKGKTPEKQDKSREFETRMTLASRFPQNLWQDSILYYKKS